MSSVRTDEASRLASGAVHDPLAEPSIRQGSQMAVQFGIAPGSATFALWRGAWVGIGDFTNGVVQNGGKVEVTGDRKVRIGFLRLLSTGINYSLGPVFGTCIRCYQPARLWLLITQVFSTANGIVQ